MACGGIAEVAWQVNERTENIGARRLHTVMERLLDVASYEAADQAGPDDHRGCGLCGPAPDGSWPRTRT